MKSVVLSTCLLTTVLVMPVVSQADAMLGAYIKSDGWSLTEIDRFNAVTNKPMAVINLFSTFDYDWGYLKYQSDNIVSRNAVPMITWMPTTQNQSGVNILTQITGGQWDVYLQKWIDGFKWFQSSYPIDKKPKILLRFGHEFNGNWYPWSNTPAKYKAAWQYIYNKFKAAGINSQIEWVWCANNSSVDNYNDITRYYPGNAYVDWTGIDGYNWGSNYSFSSWKSFDETFSSPYVTLVNSYPTKPIILGEVASAEPADLPNLSYGQNGNDSDANQSKAAWVTNMFSRLQTSYPAIRAVSWFNVNKELSWALHETNNTGLTEYNQAIQSTYFLGTFKSLKP